MKNKNEKFCISRLKSGAGDTYKTIFDLYYKPLCSFAKKYVTDLQLAEDIIQDLFLKLWEQRRDITIKSSLRSYLFQSARNECLNYLKHQAVTEKYKEHLSHVQAGEFFLDSMEEEEINQLIYKTIRSLPPRCRQVFEMSRFEGKSFEAIASELSISKNTIKNQLVDALKQIRETLEKNGISVLLFFFKKIALGNI